MQQLKNNIKNWIETVKKAVRSIKQNRDLLAFVLFLVLSIGLWFLNALRKEYTTTISYPVKYENFPKDYILLGEPQDKIDLKIKSLGYSILPYYWGKILNPEQLNVSSFRRIKQGNKYGAFVLTRDISKDFSSKLSNGIELLEIFPDTLFVSLEKKERKRVAVKFEADLFFEQQYYQSGNVSLKPDSVEISGPASLVDSVTFVSAKFELEEALRDSLVRNVSIKGIDKLEITPSRVVVDIPVEPFTQKNLRIPVDHLNIPDSLSLKSFPGVINITFTVAASRYSRINAQDFSAIIDYNQRDTKGLPDRLKVRLLQRPSGIKNVTYSPLFVDCLFEKKAKK
ncbi:CdaR family protein [Labilibacter marinus]|uniref:CdaR family protein n=1 Tax=Labilibacter marinus TaxID=1477105 RepID=UPI00082EF555|nr:CdaR family protein [Labilibacter marinus]